MRAGVRVQLAPVLGDAVVHGSARSDHTHFAARRPGLRQCNREPRALGAGEVRNHACGAVVAEDCDGVVRSKCAGDGSQAFIDAVHHVGRQTLVDDKGYGKRKWVGGEKNDSLTYAVLKHAKLAPVERRDQAAFLVADRYRDKHFVDRHDDGGGGPLSSDGDVGCFLLLRRGALRGDALIGGSGGRCGRCSLVRAGGDCIRRRGGRGSGLYLTLQVAQAVCTRGLRRRRVGDRAWLLRLCGAQQCQQQHPSPRGLLYGFVSFHGNPHSDFKTTHATRTKTLCSCIDAVWKSFPQEQGMKPERTCQGNRAHWGGMGA